MFPHCTVWQQYPGSGSCSHAVFIGLAALLSTAPFPKQVGQDANHSQNDASQTFPLTGQVFRLEMFQCFYN